MVTRLPQRVLDRLFGASLVTIMGLPPKDPHDDDDENEGVIGAANPRVCWVRAFWRRSSTCLLKKRPAAIPYGCCPVR